MPCIATPVWSSRPPRWYGSWIWPGPSRTARHRHVTLGTATPPRLSQRNGLWIWPGPPRSGAVVRPDRYHSLCAVEVDGADGRQRSEPDEDGPGRSPDEDGPGRSPDAGGGAA